jgi:hypothetical protein
MKKNMGTADKTIRLVIAIGLLAYAAWKGSFIALAASAFVFFEYFMSWCVFYAMIGKNSCPRK